jgi:hypothetical protein
VWIAESDDAAEPDFLRTTVAALTSAGAVLAFGQCRPVDEAGDVCAADYRDYLREFLPDVDWDRPWAVPGSQFRDRMLAVLNPVLTVSSVVADRATIEHALRRWAPSLPDHPTTGDWLTYGFVSEHGPVAYVPQVLTRHRRHPGSVIGTRDQHAHLHEIRLVQSRHHPVDDAVAAQAARYHAAMTDQVLVSP